MEEKKTIKISLSTFLLIIALVAISTLAVYIYMENMNLSRRIAELENNVSNKENSNIVSNVDEITENIVDDSIAEQEEQIEYVDVIEHDYVNNLHITSFTDNGDNTYTLKGMLYEVAEIPNKISDKTYYELQKGKTIKIYNEEYILSKEKDGDIVYETIVPKNEESLFPNFLIEGNYKLRQISQTRVSKFTGKYGKINVSGDVDLVINDDKRKLSTALNPENNWYYSFFNREEYELEEYECILENLSFDIENGECVGIEITAY